MRSVRTRKLSQQKLINRYVNCAFALVRKFVKYFLPDILLRGNLTWLYSNPTRPFKKSIVCLFKNKFKVLEAEEVDEQWVKFKLAVTEAAVEQISILKSKTKQK